MFYCFILIFICLETVDLSEFNNILTVILTGFSWNCMNIFVISI